MSAEGDAFAEWQELGRHSGISFCAMQAALRGPVGYGQLVGLDSTLPSLCVTAANPDIHMARQAVSIDERRCFYREL